MHVHVFYNIFFNYFVIKQAFLIGLLNLHRDIFKHSYKVRVYYNF